MAMETVTARGLSYEEYLMIPVMMQRCEVVDGEMIVNSPNIQHQRNLRQLFLLLHEHVRKHRTGEVLFAPLDILIRRDPLRVRQPDLFFVSTDRAHLLSSERVEGAPDLVVEILSPTNSRVHIAEKIADYQEIGVRECWLVSPEAQTVEVLRLSVEEVRRLDLHGVGDEVRSEVLPELHLRVEGIFAEA